MAKIYYWIAVYDKSKWHPVCSPIENLDQAIKLFHRLAPYAAGHIEMRKANTKDISKFGNWTNWVVVSTANFPLKERMAIEREIRKEKVKARRKIFKEVVKSAEKIEKEEKRQQRSDRKKLDKWSESLCEGRDLYGCRE